jgi:CheY-like chemotaxis protein
MVDMTRGMFPDEPRKKKLLIVDDVQLFLELNKIMLSRDDYIVKTATNGEEALAMVQEREPDAILLDLYMPGMDGDEVCRQIRSNPDTNHIPIIMITTESDGEGRRRCMLSGCDDFITKPVRAETISKAVRKQFAASKRRHPRMGVYLPCMLDSGYDLLKTNIHTISAGGVYVEMDTPPIPGSAHRLVFSLPENTKDIAVSALARWNRIQHGKRPVGSGFEFMEMSEAHFNQVRKWVDDTLDNPVFV